MTSKFLPHDPQIAVKEPNVNNCQGKLSVLFVLLGESIAQKLVTAKQEIYMIK